MRILALLCIPKLPRIPGIARQVSRLSKRSDLYEGCGPSMTPAMAIDGWIRGVFHRLSLLDPNLGAAAYGLYQDQSGCWVGGLGLVANKHSHRDGPVTFPGNGSRISLRALMPGEWPDPLANCAGYTYPAGLPITIQFGFGRSPMVNRAVIRREGQVLPSCTVYGENYKNDNPRARSWGRSVLNGFGGVALMPRNVLEPGGYSVRIETNEGQYGWAFWVTQ